MMFRDRTEAGKKLAEKLGEYRSQNPLVLAIPRGGVPIGCEITKALNASFDLIIPRKLPIPYEPEAGFGAVTPDGTVVLNEELVREIGLSKADIDNIVMTVLDEVQRRVKVYRNGPPIDPKGKTVIITDDGLASGYTMIAAVRDIKKKSPKKVIVAVPVSPHSSMERLQKEADEVVCLYVQERAGPFAVASFYDEFPDLSDGQVLAMLGTCPIS